MVNEGVEEQLRIAIGTALVQSGWFDSGTVEDGPDEGDLLEFHACDKACRDGGRFCACSGVPYVSQMIWDKIDKFGNLSKAIEMILNERDMGKGA